MGHSGPTIARIVYIAVLAAMQYFYLAVLATLVAVFMVLYNLILNPLARFPDLRFAVAPGSRAPGSSATRASFPQSRSFKVPTSPTIFPAQAKGRRIRYRTLHITGSSWSDDIDGELFHLSRISLIPIMHSYLIKLLP